MSLTPSTSSYSKLSVADDLERGSLQKLTSKPTSKKSNYGSLKVDTVQQTAKVFIVNYKHKLMPGETLQGLSLKYGVPIETIKRANRLWSSDIAFVKDALIVPIGREKLKELNIEYNDQLNSNEVGIRLNEDNSNHENLENEEYKNFFGKFDNFINQSKLKLKNLETNPNLAASSSNDNLNNNSNSNGYSSERHNRQYEVNYDNNKKNNSKNNIPKDAEPFIKSEKNSSVNYEEQSKKSTVNLETLPDYVIASPNNYQANYYSSASSTSSNAGSRARLAQENLQRLEREKDELYEL